MISGVSWSIHHLRDRRSRTNSLTSKIAEEQSWARHVVGTSYAQASLDAPVRHLRKPCCSVEGEKYCGVSPRHYS